MTEIIDAHHHLWRYTEQEYGWISPQMQVLQRDFMPEDLRAEKALADVSGSVVVQARQTIEETDWLLACAASDPSIRGVVGWLPLADARLPALLQNFRDHSQLKGLRHVVQDEPDDNFILSEGFNRGISALLDTGLVYDILIHERHLPQASMFVRNHPHQTFVLDHLAKPQIKKGLMEPWRADLARLAASPNVFCKLSGLVTEADWSTWTLADLRPYLDRALELFGPERLMAGSDWPVCLLASGYAQWWAALAAWMAELAPASRALMLGGTASSVYRL